ncbi:MAG: hypothetical protein Fur009_1690 [Candidatus Microgenomates bacterium]
MDEFFYYISKAIIVIPAIIVIYALILKFNQKPTDNYSQNYSVKNKISITLSPTLPITKKIEKLGINLDDHWFCQFKLDNQSYKLEINKRKINLEENIAGNIKKYDLSLYASFIENYLNMDVNDLENQAKSYLPFGLSIKELIKNCKKI